MTPPETTLTPARMAEAGVDPMFVERWSPRAFDSEPVPPATLRALFEAARWAPSSFNEQPWLFIYAASEEELARFRPLLIDSNRRWADRAPVLAFLFARRHRANGKPNRTYAFDTGSAWMSLALQAHRLGLAAHGMAGIHVEQVYDALGVPREEYEVMCAIAVGRRGDPSSLPDDLQMREKPSGRKPPTEVAVRGRFGQG